jgi:hypothetical protein
MMFGFKVEKSTQEKMMDDWNSESVEHKELVDEVKQTQSSTEIAEGAHKTLYVSVTQPDASIYVDGRLIEGTSVELPITQEEHHVKVIAEGSSDFERVTPTLDNIGAQNKIYWNVVLNPFSAGQKVVSEFKKTKTTKVESSENAKELADERRSKRRTIASTVNKIPYRKSHSQQQSPTVRELRLIREIDELKLMVQELLNRDRARDTKSRQTP